MTNYKYDNIHYLDGKPVTVKATIIPPDPSVGDPESYEDFYVYDKKGNELDISKDDEYELAKQMWENLKSDREIRKCIRRHGYMKCWDAGII